MLQKESGKLNNLIAKKKPNQNPNEERTKKKAARSGMYFAFDFGEYAVKVVQAKVNKGKIEIRKVFVIEKEKDFVRIKESELKEWRRKIMHAFSRGNVNPSGRSALCLVPDSKYIIREIDIPYASYQDRQGLIANEMGQLLSLNTEDYVFQHKVRKVYDDKGIKMCRALAAAVPKEYCKDMFELMRSMKMKPEIMDIAPNGLERFISADSGIAEHSGNSTVAVIDYGMRSTKVFFFENGEYRIKTNIESGDAKLVNDARNHLGNSVVDIHNQNKLVINPQLVYGIMRESNASDTAYEFMKGVENWVRSIDETIKRYGVDHPENSVTEIYIYGGSRQLAWLKVYLEKYIRIPVTVISRCSGFHPSARIKNYEELFPQIVNAAAMLLS